MLSVIDLPTRESSQSSGGNYTADVVISWPTFTYWLKAGIAFTIGAGIVTVIASVVGFVIRWAVVIEFLRAWARHP